jgi:putative transposase
MYQWRKLSGEDQQRLLAYRKQLRRPWHSPPRYKAPGNATYHITAACYEHANFIGTSPERMTAFSTALLNSLATWHVHAWCVLPNHYHLLLSTAELHTTTKTLSLLHGRCSFSWNGEDAQRGRKVWTAPCDRCIRNDGHLWASLNYIHHNPVKHDYCEKWTDWPWSSAESYLEAVGRKEALNRWRAYPVLEYGKGWDD